MKLNYCNLHSSGQYSGLHNYTLSINSGNEGVKFASNACRRSSGNHVYRASKRVAAIINILLVGLVWYCFVAHNAKCFDAGVVHTVVYVFTIDSQSVAYKSLYALFDGEVVKRKVFGEVGSLTVKKAKNTKIIGLQFGRTNFCSYLCSNTRYCHSRVFANL